MSQSRRPVVAYTIPVFENEDGPRYCIYCDAYGLEMSIDDEWPIDTILMASPELVDVITDETEVTSMGTVFAGASAAPPDGDYKRLADVKASHVLLSPADDIASAFAAGLSVILQIDAEAEFAKTMGDLVVSADKLVVAVRCGDQPTPATAQSVAYEVRQDCLAAGCGDARIVISAEVDADAVMSFLAMDDVDGLLLTDSSFEEVNEILNEIAVAAE